MTKQTILASIVRELERQARPFKEIDPNAAGIDVAALAAAIERDLGAKLASPPTSDRS